jgi:hypothetical protein
VFERSRVRVRVDSSTLSGIDMPLCHEIMMMRYNGGGLVRLLATFNSSEYHKRVKPAF